MKRKSIDIRAQIKVLSFSETGRTSGNAMKIDIYYPIFKLGDQLNDVFLIHKSKEFLKSEDKTNIGIHFKFPALQIGRLSVNDTFELTEGSRTTIMGRITEVVNHLLDKSQWEANLSKSIEQLENQVWQELEIYPSSLVQKCHQLRKEPLLSLTNEQLRLSISQEIGIRYTIPLVIQKLIANKFIESDFYPGDLLQATFKKLNTDWGESEFLKDEITFLVRNRFNEIQANEEMPQKVKREIYENLSNYENTRDNKP